MEDNEIEVLSRTNNIDTVITVLYTFIDRNQNVFSFPSLAKNNKRAVLWTAIFQCLQNGNFRAAHIHCIVAIRLLSRDKADIDNLICERWITTLMEIAGLFNFDGPDEKYSGYNGTEMAYAVEALKSLCNLTFNSEVARLYCAQASIAQGLLARLRDFSREKCFLLREDLMLFDMKLLFILTALRQDVKTKIKDEHGMDYLINCLGFYGMREPTNAMARAGCSSKEVKQQYILQDKQQAIACEILKTQFNLILQSGSEEPVDEQEEAMFLKLMPVLTSLLNVQTSSEEKLMELRSNITNLLTSVPSMYYHFLTPDLDGSSSAQYTFEGKNMDALQALIQLLQYKLNFSMSTKNQYENLSPILTVLNKSARGVRAQRKYLRQVVLPPLRDVSRPPEQGDTLRNQLCRLLTTLVVAVRDLTAEFLFILCKEKVGRMVKYTGFGNAAGHLAQKGLLGGGPSGAYSSSDDSDTEEYREAQPHIDPVVGCTRPPRTNPFEGMSEEQKEVEAMKLVNLFDKLLADGVMTPARIGPDGRPQAVEHVLQLRDDHMGPQPQ